jgi:hypothetical protein
LALLVLASLALNLLIVVQLASARRAVLRLAEEAARELAPLEEAHIRYDVQVRQSLPVAAQVPFRENLTVPIQATIPVSVVVPIHQRVEVPVDAGLLRFNLEFPLDLDVPVRLEVPVDLQVPVAISRTVDLSTTVPVSLTIPVDIPLADTPLGPALRRAREMIEGARP